MPSGVVTGKDGKSVTIYLQEMREWFHLLCSKKKTSQDIRRGAHKFEGLYEPVYRLSQNEDFPTGALNEWQIRAEHICPNGELTRTARFCAQSTWAKKNPQRAARHLVKCFQAAGVSREEIHNGRLLVSPLQASAYRALDGHLICSGEVIPIIAAAWYCNGLVVEHGLSGEFK